MDETGDDDCWIEVQATESRDDRQPAEAETPQQEEDGDAWSDVKAEKSEQIEEIPSTDVPMGEAESSTGTADPQAAVGLGSGSEADFEMIEAVENTGC